MFKKYNSIENTYRTEFLDKIQSHGFSKDTFIVQEKVHGANLSFYTTDGINFRAAKRTATLGEDERFYNHQPVLEANKERMMEIWKQLKEAYPDMSQMTIFGELIGGNYPHKEVKRNPEAIKVQKGVYYSPDNLFYAFDILLDITTYLDVEVANTYFEAAGLLYAKTLFKGTLSDCLAYSNAFESTIPALLGFPPVENNICEGVVIRPLENLHFGNGQRVILKNKNEKWAENVKVKNRIDKQTPIPEKVIKLREAIAGYATENRLNNVWSKIGEVTRKDFGTIMGMFNKDIVTDFLKDYAEETKDLEKKELKLVTKSLGKVTAGLINERLRSNGI